MLKPRRCESLQENMAGYMSSNIVDYTVTSDEETNTQKQKSEIGSPQWKRFCKVQNL